MLKSEIEESETILLQGVTKEERQEFLRIAEKMLQNLDTFPANTVKKNAGRKNNTEDGQMNENELMGSMKVSKAVAKMAIPSVISSLVTVVYNMADTFFVGQTGDPLQVAAVSLTNPIFILLMAFANMFGMGGSAVASMAMGEKMRNG